MLSNTEAVFRKADTFSAQKMPRKNRAPWRPQRQGVSKANSCTTLATHLHTLLLQFVYTVFYLWEMLSIHTTIQCNHQDVCIILYRHFAAVPLLYYLVRLNFKGLLKNVIDFTRSCQVMSTIKPWQKACCCWLDPDKMTTAYCAGSRVLKIASNPLASGSAVCAF